jgi:hypothetical protein
MENEKLTNAICKHILQTRTRDTQTKVCLISLQIQRTTKKKVPSQKKLNFSFMLIDRGLKQDNFLTV